MKITKHFVFRTVVSERSYGKIREAPKTWNLHKYLKTAENLKNFISKTLRPSELFFYEISFDIDVGPSMLWPSPLQPHFNKSLSAISPHPHRSFFRKEKLTPKLVEFLQKKLSNEVILRQKQSLVAQLHGVNKNHEQWWLSLYTWGSYLKFIFLDWSNLWSFWMKDLCGRWGRCLKDQRKRLSSRPALWRYSRK